MKLSRRNMMVKLVAALAISGVSPALGRLNKAQAQEFGLSDAERQVGESILDALRDLVARITNPDPALVQDSINSVIVTDAPDMTLDQIERILRFVAANVVTNYLIVANEDDSFVFASGDGSVVVNALADVQGLPPFFLTASSSYDSGDNSGGNAALNLFLVI